MSIPTDELPARMKRLDEAALREFALQFGPRLQRLFLRRGLPAADADALTVSCLSDAVLKIELFRSAGPGSFERWVFALARNAWISAWRRREHFQPLTVEPAWPERPDWNEPSEAVGQAVDAALAQLSEVDQKIIRLHQYDGLSFSEIGQQLQLQEEATRVRHHRALKRLAELLKEQPVIQAWQHVS